MGAVLALMFLAGSVGFVAGTGRPPSEGSADVGFLRDMAFHHDQAVVMASAVLDETSEPLVRTFAKEIVMVQRYEMGVMDTYLNRWGYSAEPSGDTAKEWMGMAVPRDEMPGMASESQMRALRDAEGKEADRLFLTMMIEHHRGGADMAEAGARLARDRRVRSLGEGMARNQRIEINELEGARQRLGL